MSNSTQWELSVQSTLLDRLRNETREVHEVLERQLPLTRPDLSLAQYRELLERFHSFYLYFESEVLPKLPSEWLLVFEKRRKLPALENDLRFLGSANFNVARCHDFPRYVNLPQILGALYVVEGATLGGQLITRHVKQQLGLSEQQGLQFFSSYGAEVGSKWQSFRRQLEQSSSSVWDDEIVESARQTFVCLQRCLDNSNQIGNH